MHFTLPTFSSAVPLITTSRANDFPFYLTHLHHSTKYVKRAYVGKKKESQMFCVKKKQKGNIWHPIVWVRGQRAVVM